MRYLTRFVICNIKTYNVDNIIHLSNEQLQFTIDLNFEIILRQIVVDKFYLGEPIINHSLRASTAAFRTKRFLSSNAGHRPI